VDWILSQFSKNRIEARKKYREFVLAALNMSESPLKKVEDSYLSLADKVLLKLELLIYRSKSLPVSSGFIAKQDKTL